MISPEVHERNGMTSEKGGLPDGLGHGTWALRLQDGASTTGSTRMTLKQWSGLKLPETDTSYATRYENFWTGRMLVKNDHLLMRLESSSGG